MYLTAAYVKHSVIEKVRYEIKHWPSLHCMNQYLLKVLKTSSREQQACFSFCLY